MRIFAKALKSATGMAASLVLLSGCAVNMQVPIKDPTLSTVAYNKTGSLTPVGLTFKDEQTATDKAKFLTGTIPMQMVYQDKPFDAVPWITQHTMKEMVQRGLPVSLAAEGANSTSVLIKRIHIENHRTSGFSPFVTLTSFRADVMTARGTQLLIA
jgi:uncharacterized lipoprotein YajG